MNLVATKIAVSAANQNHPENKPGSPTVRKFALAQKPRESCAGQGLSVAKIAAEIRSQIRTKVRMGSLPNAKYSVTSSEYSMGQSIDVRVSALPFKVLNEEAFYAEEGALFMRFDSENFKSRQTDEAKAVEETIQAIVDLYNYDRSDSQMDYVDVRFHASIDLDDSAEYAALERRLVATARAAK